MANGNGPNPLGSPPDIDLGGGGGGIGSALQGLGTEADRFVRSLLALRRQKEDRALRRARLRLQQQSQERLRRQGEERLDLTRQLRDIQRQRVEDEEADREARQRKEQRSRDALDRLLADARGEGGEELDQDEAGALMDQLTNEDFDFFVRRRAALQGQRQQRGRQRVDEARQRQLQIATNEMVNLLGQGVGSEEAIEALKSRGEELFPDLSDEDFRLAFSQAARQVREQQGQLRQLLRSLGGEEGLDQAGLGREPIGGLVEPPGRSDGEGERDTPAADEVVTQAQQAVARGADPEAVVARAEEEFGEDSTEAQRVREAVLEGEGSDGTGFFSPEQLRSLRPGGG